MLSPELKKLKEQLEGKDIEIDKEKLLEELKKLDKLDKLHKINIRPIQIKNLDIKPRFKTKSLSLSTGVCQCCGRKL